MNCLHPHRAAHDLAATSTRDPWLRHRIKPFRHRSCPAFVQLSRHLTGTDAAADLHLHLTSAAP
jgi:hypothetical protein